VNFLEKQIQKFDKIQRKSKALGFVYAVIKKYGEDEAGYQAALITYYGFLSLFPLFIIITMVLKLVFNGHSHLRQQVLNHLSQYVPILGSELQHNVHNLPRTDLGLLVVLLLTLYGARGGAAAVRHALSHIWIIPRDEWLGFPPVGY
jgi:membrane protein